MEGIQCVPAWIEDYHKRLNELHFKEKRNVNLYVAGKLKKIYVVIPV